MDLFILKLIHACYMISFPGGSDSRESACNSRDQSWIPVSGRSRRKWQPTLVFFPGKSHGQRSMAVYSTWCLKESDMTE